jgi:autophagy-related protein 5
MTCSSIVQVSFPRVSYLPLLLPRLHAFFSPSLIADASTISPYDGFFTYDSVPLKWHLPLGLLYDLYALSLHDTTADPLPTKPPLPFKVTLHFSSITSSTQPLNLICPTPPVLHDSFINSVKEADFLRSGTAKPIMSLSAADSKSLWSSTQACDLPTFARIHSSLLPPPGQFRNIPIRVYIPSASAAPNQENDDDGGKRPLAQAQIKVLQSHIPPFIVTAQTANLPSRTPTSQTPQTLGTALHNMLPRLFPSRRTPIFARPILHGVSVPMSAQLEELARYACYADGWLGIVVVMNS